MAGRGARRRPGDRAGHCRRHPAAAAPAPRLLGKPANITLTSAGPRLLDFGIAAIVDGTRLTRAGGGPGRLTYMAPEQFGDEPVGPAADTWAWACCVVCAARGTSPFQATSTGAVIRRIVGTAPEPSALAAVRALTVDPAGRPVQGAALVDC
ncbi:hypothetical protein ACIOHC_35530 [Streptomyces sp. NPDC088252]|uniref:protein kinase domain-containing protein n=1 Tax=Streptomyces sp. NPDC088252 TaxID=3365845 RepID=UPI003809F15E